MNDQKYLVDYIKLIIESARKEAGKKYYKPKKSFFKKDKELTKKI